jgi:hypothetical protein
MHEEFGATKPYGLAPAIIKTCSQISSDASRVPYTKNTFFKSTVRYPNYRLLVKPTLVSRITRYTRSTSERCSEESLEEIDGMRKALSDMTKVLKWRVFICRPPICTSSPYHASFLLSNYFSISANSIGGTRSRLSADQLADPPWKPKAFADILQPLQSLRNLQHFEIRDTEISELPDYITEMHFGSVSQLARTLDFEKSLTRFVTGNSPTELDAINRSLVKYARSFERPERLVREMGKVLKDPRDPWIHDAQIDELLCLHTIEGKFYIPLPLYIIRAKAHRFNTYFLIYYLFTLKFKI